MKVEHGWVTLRERSYRQAQERHRVAEARRKVEEEAAEHARQWARECLAGERRLSERCTYLYGLAARLGATAEQLAGP